MPDVTISYKGSSVAAMDASGTKTLETRGKYCEGDITVRYVKPGAAGAADDKTYSFSNPAIEAFISGVTYTSDYSSSSVEPYTQRSDANLGAPSGVDVALNAGTLRQSNAGMVNAETVSAGTKTLYNYQPQKTGSYAVVNNGAISNFGNVTASGNVRVIYGSTLKNMRDLGGWACDGGSTRYGLLYRCSELTGSGGGTQMSTTDKNMLQNLLGVRAELDMRDISEDGGTASFDSIVTYLHQTIGNYDGAFSSNNIGKFKLAAEFLMENAMRGIPTVYHCVAGADRTGTISWILLGVLGVSQSDCDKEYEITSFSGPARFRNGNLANLYAYVNGLDGDDFTHKCMQALINCGVSIDLINHFRHAMIDGSPADLEPNVIIEPITVVVDDLKACTRMSYAPSAAATSMSNVIGNDNGGLALAVSTANEWSFADRENGTFYLMPIPDGCNHVTVTTTDAAIVKYKFAALNSQSGTLTRVTNTGYVDTNEHQWTLGAANYICISCIYSVDGATKPSWSYDTSRITVTFTNG